MPDQRRLSCRRRVSRTTGLAVIVAIWTCAQAVRAQDLKLAWVKTDDSVALINHGKVVWQFNHGKDHPKPCFHPLATLDGTVLTDFRPSDHLWHRAAFACVFSRGDETNMLFHAGHSDLSEGMQDEPGRRK